MRPNLIQAIVQQYVEVRCDTLLNNRMPPSAIKKWCGHDPGKPKFFTPDSKHKHRPDIIQWARLNLKKFYEEPKKWLQSLYLALKSSRQQRSEGRERDAAVLGVLLHYLDLASLRVGVPQDDGGFFSLNMKFIAKKLGWRTIADDVIDKASIAEGKAPFNRGVKRVWRSIEGLKRAGYVTVNRRFKKVLDGEKEYIGLSAVRCIHPKLFWELGISGTELRAKRDQAIKRLKERRSQYAEKIQPIFQKGVDAIAGFTKTFQSKSASCIGFSSCSAERDTERRVKSEHDRLDRIFELKEMPENKSLSNKALLEKYPTLKKSQSP